MSRPAQAATPVIRARGVSVVYLAGTPFENWALKELELDVRPGELLGVVGSTGSGKSTLVQALCGLLDPSQGAVEYGEGIDPASPATSVGLVFQQPEDQIFERTVADEVGFGPRQLSLPEPDVAARVQAALAAVGMGSPQTLTRSPFEMSGGEKRRVAIASLLAMEPRVLIFDEPTAGLDASGRRQLLGHIRRLHDKQGRTVIVVSHDMEMLAGLADALIVMGSGRLLRIDTPAAIYGQPELMAAAGLRPPVWVELLETLRARGLQVRPGFLRVEEAVEEIRRAVRSAKKR
ncbi:MAG: ATP-binding cassette domain-containing protein [Candidatus Wallbacteria bacterium]|nr:ATP-binding cassette domain-containing protein [Candidatus Wallbacteria bacterium]